MTHPPDDDTSPPPLRSILKVESSGRRRGREVVFDIVEIRYHAMELGDHPAVSIGAAVTLAWQACGTAVFDLDRYELDRITTRRTRPRLLLWNYYQRTDILQRAGYSMAQITAASRGAAQQKRQREITTLLGPLHRVESGLRRIWRGRSSTTPVRTVL